MIAGGPVEAKRRRVGPGIDSGVVLVLALSEFRRRVSPGVALVPASR